VVSSRIGCLAPCYFRVISNPSVRFPRVLDDFIEVSRLVFDTSNRVPVFGRPPDFLMEIQLGIRHTGWYPDQDEGDFAAPDTESNLPHNTYISYYRPVGDDLVRTSIWYHFGEHLDRYRAHPSYEEGYALATYLVDPIFREGSKLAVKVTAGQDGCIIYNTETDAICLDSRRGQSDQYTPCV